MKTTPQKTTRPTSVRTALGRTVAACLSEHPASPETRRALASAIRRGVSRLFGGDAPAFYRAAGISRFRYSKMLSHPEKFPPSKEATLQMALAFRFPPDEAASFLALAGYALSPALPADRVWSACFAHGLYHLPSVRRLLAKHAGPSRRTMLTARQQLGVEG